MNTRSFEFCKNANMSRHVKEMSLKEAVELALARLEAKFVRLHPRGGCPALPNFLRLDYIVPTIVSSSKEEEGPKRYRARATVVSWCEISSHVEQGICNEQGETLSACNQCIARAFHAGIMTPDRAYCSVANHTSTPYILIERLIITLLETERRVRHYSRDRQVLYILHDIHFEVFTHSCRY